MKRKDNKILLMAGLYDSVILEGIWENLLCIWQGLKHLSHPDRQKALDIHNRHDRGQQGILLASRTSTRIPYQPRCSNAVA